MGPTTVVIADHARVGRRSLQWWAAQWCTFASTRGERKSSSGRAVVSHISPPDEDWTFPEGGVMIRPMSAQINTPLGVEPFNQPLGRPFDRIARPSTSRSSMAFRVGGSLSPNPTRRPTPGGLLRTI